jgi:uncharacterized protein (TIGR02246 family)
MFLAAVLISVSSTSPALAFQAPAVDVDPPLVKSPPPVSTEGPEGKIVTAPVFPADLAIERRHDVAAIQALTASFVKAYNAGDSAAVARTFAVNARIIDEENQLSEGRAAITERFARRFAEQPGETIAITPESIRFIGPDTAIEEGTAVIKTPPAPGTRASAETTRYTVVYVKFDGAWLHADVRDHVISPTTISASAAAGNSNYDRLRALEWLVGDWVEEGSDVELTSSFAWADNRNYLIRTFNLKVPGRPLLTGTQRIGWDPSTQRIRSWEFDSDGDFGEGDWSRRGDAEWVVKMSGVRRDGRIATDTRVIVRTGTDHLTWQALDRTLGGEVQEDTPKFTMVRRAPAPGEAKIKRVTQ